MSYAPEFQIIKGVPNWAIKEPFTALADIVSLE